MMDSPRGIYGYVPGLSYLRDLNLQQRADCLASLGATIVFGGYDDAELASALRRRGFGVMAEFACFVGEEWWRRHPDSRPVLADGNPLPPDGGYYGVNPAHSGVREALLARLRALMARQPLDGLWLDFIRWPCHWEAPTTPLPETSFDGATVAAFCREYGLPAGEGQQAAQALLGEYSEAWHSWRCRQVTAFAAEAAAIVRESQPNCLVGAFTVPWRRDDRGGALRRIVGQELAALSAHVDVFSPMAYHRMCGRSPAWIADICQDVRAATGRPVWPIVQSVDEPPGMTAAEYRAALETALSAGDGALVFNLQGLQDRARREATGEMFGGAA